MLSSKTNNPQDLTRKSGVFLCPTFLEAFRQFFYFLANVLPDSAMYLNELSWHLPENLPPASSGSGSKKIIKKNEKKFVFSIF